MNGYGKVFMGVITSLITIAMGLGAFAVERINHLYETKASVVEVHRVRETLKELRTQMREDLKEMRKDLTDIKVALGVPDRKKWPPYR